ncbi:IPTL-CTERM sorting domain-containing protein [Comamonas piscis]|uniref:IPTL-CTERM sorting domain-containing protein n=1 Tax=Comamonas piscis TaxID=1562974 RepID=A0A7G5EIC9_9BURK|nr:IPTL-CTERM sorting domain-containing protein [Comamonas piscis]QMV73754.1 IPTL-CTERM sorting domain-containing protein [Comamonas piscis]WSO32178.1 IPTL-CTERM sorting domain-containing protein [Comamonas piscis]
MKSKLRFLSLLLFSLIALPMIPAYAQKVLMLSTTETAVDGINILNNMQNEFSNAGATVTREDILGQSGSVIPATFLDSQAQPYDLVIVATVYNAVDAGNWTAIQNAVQGRSANAFLLFTDSCCQPSANLAPALNLLNSASGLTMGLSPLAGRVNTPLNTSSAYQGSFTNLPFFEGNAFQYWTQVPADNTLYYDPNQAIPVPVSTDNRAYGVFFPIAQSFNGAGACLFGVSDTSGFDANSYPINQGKVGISFLNSVKSGGACGLAGQVSKEFSPSTVNPNKTSTLTISIANTLQPPASVSDLYVQDQLPAPLSLVSVTANTCGGSLATSSNSLTLTGGNLPAAGCSITAIVRWAEATCTSASVTNTITPGTEASGGQFSTSLGQVNIPATADLACAEAPIPATPTPVPTVGEWSLFTLTSLLGVAGFFATRRRKI